MDDLKLEPLEIWLKEKCKDGKAFPQKSTQYFNRYLKIKEYLETEVYPLIGAATSAEDQGIYTDHSKEHFSAVIRYAGLLLGLDHHEENHPANQDIKLRPYEVYVMLVSILLHDAGNVFGRDGHEKKAMTIFTDMGPIACPDKFEARPIASIASAHGGKFINAEGDEDKDTIRKLKEFEEYAGQRYQPRLIAAIVRFADEICEDRSRAARFLLRRDALPEKSKIFHAYANAISSVSVDLRSKAITLKFDLDIGDIEATYEKEFKGDKKRQYLIDEINERLEKMYMELLYCRSFMVEVVNVDTIRATVSIFGEDEDSYEPVEENAFILREEGYPSGGFSFSSRYPSWNGQQLKDTLC